MNKLEYKIKNSFFDERLTNKKVLVIVPHEDDEINVAGNVILDFLHKGCTVYCAFSTNGDYSFFGKTRIQEAVNSLHVLGVKHIFFLGYGDSPGYYKKGHIFSSEKDIIESHAGRNETYGTALYPDFSWIRRKRHSSYCKSDFKKDMKDLILYVKADIIFCVDCDVHADHRACSLTFEEIMCEILKRQENTYQPIIFKGFAYCTAFDAPIDFYQDNIASTKKTKDDKSNIVGQACYEWDKRVRFPVVTSARAVYLRENILYKALFAHKSQSIALRACRIINGDNVFWRRRTDSLSYQANVSASSGCAERVVDFQLFNLASICTKTFSFGKYLWSPKQNDLEKKITFSWQQRQIISTIILYGNINKDSRILKFSISLDNGYFKIFGPMPEDGNGYTINLPNPQYVQECTIQILKWSGHTYGFAECEFYNNVRPLADIAPFIKMKLHDDFIYEYIVDKRNTNYPIEIYSYPYNIPVIFKILQGKNSVIDEKGNLFFSNIDDAVVVRAEAKNNPDIYDEIIIRHVSRLALYKRRWCQKLERILLTIFLKKYRKYVHIQQKYLKKM